MEEYIAHYGVLGMKWGVRHNPQRAYDKSVKKVNRIQKRADKFTKKANKYFNKGVSKSGGLFANDKKAQKSFNTAAKKSRKALRQVQKGAKWIKRMEKEFSKQTVVTIDSSIIEAGKTFTNRISSAADQMYLRNIA